MDAISFVLGIKSSHLRSTQLRDLIYRGRVIRTTKINADGTATEANGDADGETQGNGDTQSSSQRHDPHSAWVMAVFEDDAEQIHRWKRTITNAGQSEYRIDGRLVTQKAYNDALEEQSILIKARNFLVFQGDVENVASQNPKELTRLIEQISGSLEYKADYERLKEEAEKAQDNQASQLDQRRKINADIKTYQEQKAEAEEYEAKVAERDQAIVTHVLWKLFHFQQTIERSSDEIAKHQEELKEHRRGVEKYEQRLEAARQAQAKVSREVSKLEKSIRSKEKEIADAENNLVPIDEKIKISERDLQKYEGRLENLINQRDDETKRIDRYKKDLATVQKAQQKWEDEFSVAQQQQGGELSAQDLQEYNRLRGDVTRQTHANRIEINRLEREVSTDKDTVRNLKQKVETFQDQIQKLEDEIKQLEDNQKQAKARGKELEKERASKQLEYNKMQSDRRQTESRYHELNQDLQDTYRKLSEAEGGRRQSQKELATKETIKQMRNIFGNGVHGTLWSNCKPKQKKYETAVATLLGWRMDAVVTDTDKIARECIQYLKDQKLGVMQFIPLDTIAVKGIDQNLKGLHSGMRLGIDCIDYEPYLERAMAFATGNSMICDDIKTAKYLCFEKRVDAKAVTLDGTVIAKGGTITGGRLASDKSSQRWNDQAVENLQKLADKYKAQLSALPKLDRRSQEEETLQIDLADLEDQIRRIQDEIKAFDRNIASKKAELKHHKQQLREVQPKYNEKASRLQNHETELQGYQDEVDQVADTVFAAFCTRLGYNSIRDYEAQQGSLQQEAAEKRVEFTKQRSKLQSMLTLHERNLESLNERIKAVEEHSTRDEANIKEFTAQKEELQNSIDVLNAEKESFEEEIAKVKDRLAERGTAVHDARKELDRRNESVKDVTKAVDTEEANIKRTAASRYALLRKCRMDEIDIPLAEGSASLNQLPMGDAAREDPDAMDVDEDADATQMGQPEVNDYGIEVDFDELDDDLKQASSIAFSLYIVILIFSRMTPKPATPDSKTLSPRSTPKSTNPTPICARATNSKSPKPSSNRQPKSGKCRASLPQKLNRISKTSSRNGAIYSRKPSTTLPKPSKARIGILPRVHSSHSVGRLIWIWRIAQSHI